MSLFSVDSEMRVKLSDSALSRDLFADDYHCLCDNTNRPVKWLAPELILLPHAHRSGRPDSPSTVLSDATSACDLPGDQILVKNTPSMSSEMVCFGFIFNMSCCTLFIFANVS